MGTRKHPGVSWVNRSYEPGDADTFSVSSLQNSLEVLSENTPVVGPEWIAGTPEEGDAWIDTASNTFKLWLEEAWRTLNPVATVDVRAYGAVGDGETDDALAFQTALDDACAAGTMATREVYVPPGEYVIGTTLRMGSDTTLRGAGWDSILKFKDGLPVEQTRMITNADHVGGNVGITLERLRLNGNRANVPIDISGANGYILTFANVVGLRVRDCLLEEAPAGALVVYDCSVVRLRDVQILHPYKFGVFVGASTPGTGKTSRDVVLDGVRVYQPGRGGIVVDSGYGDEGAVTNVTLIACTVEQANNDWDLVPGNTTTDSGYGYRIEEGVVGLRLIGCTARDCFTYGFSISGGQKQWPVRDAYVAGNEARHCSDVGFQLYYMEDALFVNNTAHHGLTRGYEAHYVKNSVFLGNLAHDNGTHGFAAYDLTNCRFEGNTARNNSLLVPNNDGFVFVADTFDVVNHPADRLTLRGNRAYDTQTIKTQRFGINFATVAGALHTNAVVRDNDARDNTNGYYLGGLDLPTVQLGDNLPATPGVPTTLRVGLGSPFPTLSAALAAITDASATKPYTICVEGLVTETAPVTLKSYVNIRGEPGAIIDNPVADNLSVVLLPTITQCKVRDLRFRKRPLDGAGNPTQVTGVQQVLFITGSPDNTVIFERCGFESLSTGATSANGGNGVLFQGGVTADCTFRDCDIVAGDYGHGLYLAVAISPLFENCRFVGGNVGTVSGAVAQAGCTALFRRCAFSGGASGGTAFRATTFAAPELVDCTLYARAGGGSTASALSVGFGATPWLRGCVIRQQGTTDAVTLAEASQTRMEHCSILMDSLGVSTRGILVNNSAELRMRECVVAPLIRSGIATITNATTFFQLDVANPTQLETLYLVINTAAAGQTLSIGTTVGGTDIVNAQSLAATGSFYPVLGVGALKLFPANATPPSPVPGPLYVTISGGTPNVTVYYTFARAYNGCSPILLNGPATGAGRVLVDGSTFVSNVDSDAGGATPGAITFYLANPTYVAFTRCTFRSRLRDTGRKKGFSAQGAWSPAPFHRCVFDGGQTNLTCAAGTANGSSLEI